MSVDLSIIEDNIVSCLDDNISDPINRTIGKWVDHGKGHFKGKTPRILVKRGRDTATNFIGCGETKQDYDITFIIVLEVQASVGGLVDNKRYTGSQLANKLSAKIDSTLETNATSIDGIKLIWRISSAPYDYDDKHMYAHIYGVYLVND